MIEKINKLMAEIEGLKAENAEQIEAFYELKIELFLVELSSALTSKVFTSREKGFGNFIIYEANKLQFASLDKKIQMYKEVVLYGGMTKNEWRHLMGYGDIEGGDIPIMRLDADYINVNEKPRQGNESEASAVAPVQPNEEGEKDGSEE